jgi:hypothetical protein
VAVVAAALLAGAAPAGAATSLVAAYDKYVVGKGFEIGLVDVGTGADIALPAGVNTADDELHPALTPDGRFLVFTREQVRPLLDGSVIPPAARTLRCRTGSRTASGHPPEGRPARRRGSSPSGTSFRRASRPSRPTS